MKSVIRFGSIAVLLLLAVGCRSYGPRFNPRQPAATLSSTNFAAVPPTNQIKADWLVPNTNAFVLGPGDIFDIQQLEGADTPITARVGPDGKVYYLFLPGTDVWGLTLAQAREKLEAEFAKSVTRPELLLTLKAVGSKSVWLLGRFAAPGIYPMTAPMRLLEAIALAGGPAASVGLTTEELGDLRHSFIMRNGEVLPIDFSRLIVDGDTSQNVYLMPDDFIYMPSGLGQQIYVLGGIASPGGLAHTGQMTLLSAIARRGGPIPYAWLEQVVILRGSLTEPKVAVVNFRHIREGKATDVLLEPRDIVYIPMDPLRKIDQYARMAMQSFVGGIAANAGAKAVNGKTSGIPFSFGGGFGGGFSAPLGR